MPGGIFPHSSVTGGTLEVRRALMTSGQTFNKGALAQILPSTGAMTVLPQDGTEILVADIVDQGGSCWGVVLNGPGAASSAAIPEDFVKTDPDTGSAYSATSWIYYVPINRGQLFRTSNILTSGGASAETAASITGADRGQSYFITYCSSPTPDLGWGVERVAATAAMLTEVYAKITDVLDARGKSVPTLASVGTQYVFEIVNNETM